MPFDYYIAYHQMEAKITMSMRKNWNTKYFIVGGGVDANLFKPKRKDSDVKVMVILRSGYTKNPELAIDTLNLLSRKLNFTAIIVHDGVLDKFKNEIHFKYEEYQLVPHEKMAELYNEATVFLFTSRMESYGLPPLEAMACGTPVVTTNNIGGREYLVHEGNALVDKSFSPNVLSEYIYRVAKDDELRERLVRNGLETAKQHDWEIITDNWVKMLKEIEEDEMK
jgi:glycosyltransferase involved in cell wall biosynthesis